MMMTATQRRGREAPSTEHRAQSTEHRAQGTGHSIEHRAQRMHRVQDKRGGESTVGQQTGSTEHQRAARR